MTRSYWDKFESSRISRRKMLAGTAAVGASAAAIALVGCGSDSKKTLTPASGSPGAGSTAAPTAAAQTAPAKTRGGIYRQFSFDPLALDTYDPHQTQFGPMFNTHSAVFSKVLQYDDDVNQVMSPDLASGMPEQPDKLTYIIKLRQGVKFHNSPRAQQDFPAVAGRELTAEDVKYSIERQINPASPQRSLYYRSGQWASVDKIEVIDPYTLKITTKAPTSPFLHFLADRNAHIVARETVDANDTMNSDKAMIGTGPFFLEAFRSTEVVQLRRNASWFAKDDNPHNIGMDRPFLDGYDSLWTPSSNSAEEAALKSKQIDSTGFEDDSTAISVSNGPGLHLVEQGIAGSINSALWLSKKSPLQDVRLRQALHLAIDRKVICEQMFPAAPGLRSFLVAGPITFPIVRWAIPQGELEQRPGYRTDAQGRAADIAEAKRLWAAASGPTTLNVLFAGLPSFIPDKAAPEFKRQLQATLGVTVNETFDPTGYTSLAQALLRNAADADEGTAVMTWGYDNGWIDLDDWLYPYYHTGGTKNSFLLSDPDLDKMLDGQRAEFDYQARRKIGLDAQNYLLDKVLARLDYCAQVGRSVDWDYLKNQVYSTWQGSNFLYANTWLDRSDPSYSGRAA